jgi:type I restriction enzyme M protein
VLDDQINKNPLKALFDQTKEAYADDEIFEDGEEIRLRPATGREIVKLLERYNLSDTSEDIKKIAFERFLGRTFRGEIGQFFTPRGPSSNSWFAWWNPKKATSSVTLRAGPVAS